MKNTSKGKRTFNSKQVAEALGVSASALSRWRATGKALASYKQGGRYVYNADELTKFIRSKAILTIPEEK